MRFVQPFVLLCGVVLLALANILPTGYFYRTDHHSVGENVVQVYAPQDRSSWPSVPVLRSSGPPRPEETSQRVEVWIRNDYKDKELRGRLFLNLEILGSFVVLYLLAGFYVLYAPIRPPPEA